MSVVAAAIAFWCTSATAPVTESRVSWPRCPKDTFSTAPVATCKKGQGPKPYLLHYCEGLLEPEAIHAHGRKTPLVRHVHFHLGGVHAMQSSRRADVGNHGNLSPWQEEAMPMINFIEPIKISLLWTCSIVPLALRLYIDRNSSQEFDGLPERQARWLGDSRKTGNAEFSESH